MVTKFIENVEVDGVTINVNQNFQIEAKVSEHQGNALVKKDDGLFVEPVASLECCFKPTGVTKTDKDGVEYAEFTTSDGSKFYILKELDMGVPVEPTPATKRIPTSVRVSVGPWSMDSLMGEQIKNLADGDEVLRYVAPISYDVTTKEVPYDTPYKTLSGNVEIKDLNGNGQLVGNFFNFNVVEGSADSQDYNGSGRIEIPITKADLRRMMGEEKYTKATTQTEWPAEPNETQSFNLTPTFEFSLSGDNLQGVTINEAPTRSYSISVEPPPRPSDRVRVNGTFKLPVEVASNAKSTDFREMPERFDGRNSSEIKNLMLGDTTQLDDNIIAGLMDYSDGDTFAKFARTMVVQSPSDNFPYKVTITDPNYGNYDVRYYDDAGLMGTDSDGSVLLPKGITVVRHEGLVPVEKIKSLITTASQKAGYGNSYTVPNLNPTETFHLGGKVTEVYKGDSKIVKAFTYNPPSLSVEPI